MKSRATYIVDFRKVCVVLFTSISLLACQNSETAETKQDQLNNNSSGMDRDHTMAPPDTLAIPESSNGDTPQLNNPKSAVDSVRQQF